MRLIRLSRQLRMRIEAFRREREGVSAIEFSFVAFPFIFLLFAIIETGYVFLLAFLLEGAAADGARDVRTGVVQLNADPVGTFEDRVCNGMLTLVDCARLNYDAQNYANFAAIPSPPLAAPTAKGTTFNTGNPGDIVVVRVALAWSYMTPFLRNFLGTGTGSGTLVASVVVQTEAYE